MEINDNRRKHMKALKKAPAVIALMNGGQPIISKGWIPDRVMFSLVSDIREEDMDSGFAVAVIEAAELKDDIEIQYSTFSDQDRKIIQRTLILDYNGYRYRADAQMEIRAESETECRCAIARTVEADRKGLEIMIGKGTESPADLSSDASDADRYGGYVAVLVNGDASAVHLECTDLEKILIEDEKGFARIDRKTGRPYALEKIQSEIDEMERSAKGGNDLSDLVKVISVQDANIGKPRYEIEKDDDGVPCRIVETIEFEWNGFFYQSKRLADSLQDYGPVEAVRDIVKTMEPRIKSSSDEELRAMSVQIDGLCRLAKGYLDSEKAKAKDVTIEKWMTTQTARERVSYWEGMRKKSGK
jgi:hypothetical protein